MATSFVSDPDRLEALWKGEFGDAYVQRNFDAGAYRRPFWDAIRRLWPFDSVLEVGCNVGANLTHFAPYMDYIAGVDINPRALREARERLGGITLVEASARALPFPDAAYGMVLCVGLLIHQSEEALPDVIREMVRVSSKWVMAAEYYAPERQEVPYRDQEGALWRDDFGRWFLRLCPELRPAGCGFVGSDLGFDRTTWWLFEKP